MTLLWMEFEPVTFYELNHTLIELPYPLKSMQFFFKIALFWSQKAIRNCTLTKQL